MHIKVRLCLEKWLYFLRMSVICCGETSVVIFGVILKKELKFQFLTKDKDRHNGGALNYYTQEFLIKPFKKGDSKSAIAFVEYLLTQYPKSRISLIWDGASYHRSVEFQDYLKSLNQGLNENEWKVTCIRFAPNDPTQNPVEDIWLSAKKFVREFYHLCKSFTIVKRLFELAVHHEIFNFPKIFMYD